MTKFVIIGLVIFAATSIAVFQILRSWTNQTEKEPGFREFVKEPSLLNDMIATSQDAGVSAEVAASWGSDQIKKQIERYVFKSESTWERWELWELRKRLRELYPRTNEALLALLRDESRQGKLLELRQGDY